MSPVTLDFELRSGHLTGRCRAYCGECGHRGPWLREPEAAQQSREHNVTPHAPRTERGDDSMWTGVQP